MRDLHCTDDRLARLYDADIVATLANARKHLPPSGRFVFEPRNPAIDWAGRWHGQSTTINYQGQPINIARTVLNHCGDQIRFTTTYALPDGILTSHSTLRFPDCNQITTWLTDAVFAITAPVGGWYGRPSALFKAFTINSG